MSDHNSGALNVTTTSLSTWPNTVTNTGTTFLTFSEFAAELARPIPWHRRVRYTLERAARRPRQWINGLRWSVQRARRGFSDADTWSFDHYIAGVIAGGLTQLRERGIGHPSHLTAEEWDKALDQMIASFQIARAGMFADDFAKTEREFRRGARIFVKEFFSLWD